MDAINYTTFYLGAQQFSSQIDPRTGTMCIHSIHPYDETEYHWARQGITGYSWFVFRAGKRIITLGGSTPLTREQVAQELLNLDRQAHLTRCGGIW